MKGARFFSVCSVFIILLLSVCDIEADVVFLDFFDGQINEINSGNSTGSEEVVRFDYSYPDIGTTLNIIEGGVIGNDCLAFGIGTVNLLGGEITTNLFMYENSQAFISNGIVGEFLHSYENSFVYISGGTVAGEVDAFGNSEIIISGGTFPGYVRTDGYGKMDIYGGTFSNDLYATQESIMTIYGTNFTINGMAVDYGPISVSSGLLTGTLVNGGSVNSVFYIGENGIINLVPEPMTILLLGLGGLALIMRRKT